MRCFLCKKNNFEHVYRLKTRNIIRCKIDGLFFAQEIIKNKTYGEEYYENVPNSFNKSYFRNKLSTIQQLILRQNSGQAINKSPYILNVGCGWGDFEEVMEKEKIPYLGIDINKQAVEICQKKGFNCKLTTIQQLSNLTIKQSFSAITMFQIIEHIKDPLPLLRSAKKLLKKNGAILITTPNNNSSLRKIFGPRWSVYNEPSHFVFYNKKTLKQTLELAGFKNSQIKIDNLRFLSSNYILNRLNQIYPSSIFNFLASNFRHLTSNIPFITDPLGDLEATVSINYY